MSRFCECVVFWSGYVHKENQRYGPSCPKVGGNLPSWGCGFGLGIAKQGQERGFSWHVPRNRDLVKLGVLSMPILKVYLDDMPCINLQSLWQWITNTSLIQYHKWLGENILWKCKLRQATRELRNGDKWLTSCRNSNNDTGPFQNSDIPSFDIQTEDMDNPSCRTLFYIVLWNRTVSAQSSLSLPSKTRN